jgi:hypothetical protein
MDELYGQVEVKQSLEGLSRHWAWKHIAPHHDLIDPGATYILKDRLQGREVTVNVIESSNPHD